MGMTIDEAKEWLISRKEHYELDDNCQELAQALDVAIETMRKYQKIKEILKDDAYYEEYGNNAEKFIVSAICEVLEDDSN